jgi:hypothetical protein
MRHSGRGRHVVAVVQALFAALACRDSTPPLGGVTPEQDSVVVVAAGDIACGVSTPALTPCRHAQTAGLVALLEPDAVLALGDLQYDGATLDAFNRFYDPTWGVLKGITYPVPGNSEYRVPAAAGYFDYFNGRDADSGRAGHRARGWYSVALGAWRVLALNSNCGAIGGCGIGSPQEQWLRAELASRSEACVLAFWHHSRFSSGPTGDDTTTQALWDALHDAQADVVLSAHAQQYERVAPLTVGGDASDTGGIRQFVVGTGGRTLVPFGATRPGSEAGNAGAFGVLRLALRRTDYTWEFIPLDPDGFADSGTASCH